MTRLEYIRRYHAYQRARRLRARAKAKEQALGVLGAVLFGLAIGAVFFFAR